MADVLCLSYGQFTNSGSAGGGDWRQFWQTAMNLQDEAGDMYDADETNSVGTIEDFERSEYRGSSMGMRAGGYASAAAYAELGESVSVISATHTTATSAMAQNMTDDTFIFKVSDRTQGHYHRILCRYDSITVLFEQVRAKMSVEAADEIRLKYEDDDGDLAVLTSDESLVEAVSMAKRAGWKRIVLLVDVVKTDAAADSSKKKKKQEAAAPSGSPSGSAKSTPPSVAGKNRRRKLTKVEEDIESDSEKEKLEDDEEEEEDSEEEEKVTKKAKAKKKAEAKSKKKAKDDDADGNNVVVLAGAASVVLLIGIGAIFFLKSKKQ
jgi:cobalamin biosynthesis Mg chelatase CobN